MTDTDKQCGLMREQVAERLNDALNLLNTDPTMNVETSRAITTVIAHGRFLAADLQKAKHDAHVKVVCQQMLFAVVVRDIARLARENNAPAIESLAGAWMALFGEPTP